MTDSSPIFVKHVIRCEYRDGSDSFSALEGQYLRGLYEFVCLELGAIEQVTLCGGVRGKPCFWIRNLRSYSVLVCINMEKAAVLCQADRDDPSNSLLMDLGHPECFERVVKWMWGLRK